MTTKARRPFLTVVAALNALALSPASVFATWSVIATDRATGRVVIASATCVAQASLERFPSKGLMDVQAIVVPGVGVAAAQAGVDRTRANQMLISGFSGARNRDASLDVQRQVPGTEIFYSIQGNILKSNAVVQNAVRAFQTTTGVMAAMEAADAAAGDSRRTCTTEPVPNAPCSTRTDHVAYLLAADRNDTRGVSHNDGQYSVYLSVTDQNIGPSAGMTWRATSELRSMRRSARSVGRHQLEEGWTCA